MLIIWIALDAMIIHVIDVIRRYGMRLSVTRDMKNMENANGIAPGPPFQNLAGGMLK